MNTALVLLNYNDAGMTLAAARRALEFPSVAQVILVDNRSTDGSREELRAAVRELPEDRAVLLLSPRNGGYGYGNNLGVRYAAEHYGAEHVLIANPDAKFTEALVKKMLDVFRTEENVGVVGAVMMPDASASPDASDFRLSGWLYRTLPEEVLHAGPLTKRIFTSRIDASDGFYRSFGGRPIPVFAVHGSLLMVDAAAFLACGGYDERMFLYMEEYVLGCRMQGTGKRTLLLPDTYRHIGSHSITGSGSNAIQRQRMRQASERIYYRDYLGLKMAAMPLIYVQQQLILWETAVYGFLQRVLHRK